MTIAPHESIKCYNINRDRDLGRSFSVPVMQSYEIVDLAVEKLFKQCLHAPTYYWFPQAFHSLMSENKEKYDLLRSVAKIHFVRGLMGVHAAYLEPGHLERGSVADIVVGFAHQDLKVWPHQCLWIFPKAFNPMLSFSQMDDNCILDPDFESDLILL